jgi:hypothetical protein
MKIIQASAEKDPETGKLKVLVEINADDSLILEQTLLAFDKYDKDDNRYIARLNSVKEQIHKTWTLTHPS